MDAETRTRTRLSKVLLCSEEKRTYYIPYIHTYIQSYDKPPHRLAVEGRKGADGSCKEPSVAKDQFGKCGCDAMRCDAMNAT